MRYLVPQFIEIEDKLFGPLTFKQFVYTVGSLGFAGAMFAVYGIVVAVLLGTPVVVIGLALAFYKVNDRPSILMFESMINYIVKKKLYLWKKISKQREAQVETRAAVKPYAQHISESRLKELAWSLDIKESLLEEGPTTFSNNEMLFEKK